MGAINPLADIFDNSNDQRVSLAPLISLGLYVHAQVAFVTSRHGISLLESALMNKVIRRTRVEYSCVR